jgi:hypothetical protein
VVTVSDVLADELFAVPVWSSAPDVAAPLNSLSCPRVFDPLEPVLKRTEDVLGALARYQISTGPALPRHEWTARVHPDGAVMLSVVQLPLMSVIVATRRSPAVDATESVSVIDEPEPVISLPLRTKAVAA